MLESHLKVRLPKLVISSLAVSALCLTTGCATNPATGRSQLSLYNEAQEIQIGQSSDPEIVQQYGLYDDPELAAYVERVGQDLAAKSERPDLPWTFRVLDDPVINAFALPGGYIYVTRGILGHMGSEAELAAVLGHEIGHVTARHGVNRLSKAQLAGVGLGIGSILAPELARSVGGLAQQGMQLLFLKYSRDDERQADSLGFRYVDRTGYTPEAFVDMFSMLSASSRGSSGSRLPGYLLTHPEPEQRLQAAHARLAEMAPEMLQRPWKRDPFMNRLDGLPYGANPDEGFFIENAFVHPGLGLRIELPDGWTGHNQKHAVVAVNPDSDALFQLSPVQESSVDEAARAFYGNQSISVRSSWQDEDPNIPLRATQVFSADSGKILGAAGFVEIGNGVLRLVAISKAERWSSNEGLLEQTLRSVSKLEDRRYQDLKRMKISLVRVPKDMSIEEFDRRYPSSIDTDRLALLNQVEPGELLKAGAQAKRVTGFDPGPQTGVKLPRNP